MSVLTVVIPAYNAGRYIEECLQSVLAQKGMRSLVKIVLVVDGATDDTFERASSIAKDHDDSIMVLSQSNAGPSAARNNGINKVRTKYVTFLDADDAWLPNYLETIAPLLAGEPDLIEYDADCVSQSGERQYTLKIASAAPKQIMATTKLEFLKIFRCYAWARIYRTEDVRNHPFPAGRRFEDSATTPLFYWESNDIVSIGMPLVRYRQHPDSILATPKDEDIREISACVRDSVAMYKLTNDSYWQHVAYRTHHFACDRIAKRSVAFWPTGIGILQDSISGVPAPAGLTRALQLRAPLLYIALIRLKRLFSPRNG